jgi:GST-like protein
MSTNDYALPKVWTHLKPNGDVFESINRPTAGTMFERDLPKGKHALQLIGTLKRREVET